MNKLDQARQLQDRTKQFAVRIIKSFAKLPRDEAARIIGKQFLRWELLSLLIIKPLVERALQLTSFRKSALLLKKPMKHYSGLNS